MADDPISFTDWLIDALPISNVPERKYRHRRLDEKQELREQILPRLRDAVQQSLEDMKRALVNPMLSSLDPLQLNQTVTVADLYPHELPLKTKMGYFGEFMAGLLCVEFEVFGESDWEVPAYLFRWHEPAIRYLERIRKEEIPEPSREVYGRQGDDCLVFRRDDNGEIISFVVCEAKCLSEHDSTAVREAHRKLSKPGNVAEDRIQVIKILEERQRHRPEPDLQKWIDALHVMEFRAASSECERYDMVCYVYGKPPARQRCWIPRDAPHDAYQGGRDLEAIEVYLDQVGELVLKVYGNSLREPTSGKAF